MAVPTSSIRTATTTTRGHRRLRPAGVATTVAWYLVALVVSVLLLAPIYWMLATSLKTSADTLRVPPLWLPWPPQWDNYAQLFGRFPFGRYVLNSVFVTTMAVTGQVLSCSLAAYGFARLRMPGRDLIFVVLMSTLMLPPVVLMVPQFVIFQRLGWINTYLPLIVPPFFGSAFSIFLLRQFFLSIPRDLDEAAVLDGAGFLRIYWNIILPLARPALLMVAIFVFVASWNDFVNPLIYLGNPDQYTVAVALRYLQGNMRFRPENQLLMAAVVVAVLPCLLLFVAAQRWFMQGTVFTGVKG